MAGLGNIDGADFGGFTLERGPQNTQISWISAVRWTAEHTDSADFR